MDDSKPLLERVKECVEEAGLRCSVADSEEERGTIEALAVVSLDGDSLYISEWDETSPAGFTGKFYDVYGYATTYSSHSPPDQDVVYVVEKTDFYSAVRAALSWVVVERVLTKQDREAGE